MFNVCLLVFCGDRFFKLVVGVLVMMLCGVFKWVVIVCIWCLLRLNNGVRLYVLLLYLV